VTATGERYRRLLHTLVRERKSAGGTLPMSVESRYACELDDLWALLSLAEQEEIEREIEREKATR